jgi:hypothetical protein
MFLRFAREGEGEARRRTLRYYGFTAVLSSKVVSLLVAHPRTHIAHAQDKISTMLNGQCEWGGAGGARVARSI